MTPTAGSNFSRYPLPADLSPEGICCICVPVPDDPQWLAMFHGAIWRLSLQTHWERDADFSARIVAAKWREIWNEVMSMTACCQGGAQQNINIYMKLIQTQIYMLSLSQLWIAAAFDVQVAFFQVPDDFDADPGDAGDGIAARNRALCMICNSWVAESFNTGMSWIEDSAVGITAIGVGALAVPMVPIWIIAAGFGAVATAMSIVYQQLANPEYREYMACAMYDALKGISTGNRAAFGAAWDNLPVRPPPPETPDQDIARDAIEFWGRAQLRLKDNYLAFVSQLDAAMQVAGELTDADCVCTGFIHIFDFEIDDQGWETMAEDSRDHGIYVAGVGWVSQFELQGDTVPPRAERLYIQIDGWPSRTITSVVAEWLVDDGSFATRTAPILLKLADVLQDLQLHEDWPQPGVFTTTWTGSETIDEIETICVDGLPALVDREYILKKVTVHGDGTDPF